MGVFPNSKLETGSWHRTLQITLPLVIAVRISYGMANIGIDADVGQKSILFTIPSGVYGLQSERKCSNWKLMSYGDFTTENMRSTWNCNAGLARIGGSDMQLLRFYWNWGSYTVRIPQTVIRICICGTFPLTAWRSRKSVPSPARHWIPCWKKHGRRTRKHRQKAIGWTASGYHSGYPYRGTALAGGTTEKCTYKLLHRIWGGEWIWTVTTSSCFFRDCAVCLSKKGTWEREEPGKRPALCYIIDGVKCLVNAYFKKSPHYLRRIKLPAWLSMT